MTRAPSPLFLVAAAIAGALLAWATFVPGAGLQAEGGPFEAASAGLLAGAAVLAAARRMPWAAILLALFALRELDYDKRAVSEGILKLRQYTGDAPLWEKALGLAVVALTILTLVQLARRWGLWRAALSAGRTWAVLLPVAAALVLVAKSIDGLGRKLAGLGLGAPDWVLANAPLLEETLELGFAACLLAVVLTFARTP